MSARHHGEWPAQRRGWRGARLALVACAMWTSTLAALAQPPAGNAAQPPAGNAAPAPAAKAAEPPAANATQSPATNAPAGSPTDPEQLPRLEAMVRPTAADLLAARPFDWIVLNRQEEVLVVEPITPRPDTLTQLDQLYKQLSSSPLPPSQAERDLRRQRLGELQRLIVVLWDDADAIEYTLEVRAIKRIIHFEDMLSEEIDQALNRRELSTAQDLLTRLFSLNARWPRSEVRLHRLWMLDAEIRLEQSDAEGAWQFLERLGRADASYPNLREKLGTALDRLCEPPFSTGDFRQVRFFLQRLVTLMPDHPAAQRWRERLVTTSQEWLRRAEEARQPREALAAVTQAARIWPELPGLRAAYRQYALAWPRLRVGVLDLPDATVAPWTRPACVRQQSLTSLRLMEPARIESSRVRYGSSVLERWEPSDLGRRVDLFLLRPDLQRRDRWPITSLDVLASLAAQGQASTQGEWIRADRTSGPQTIQLDLVRAPVRFEPLMAVPLHLQPSTLGLLPDLPEGARQAAAQGQLRFYPLERTAESVRYQQTNLAGKPASGAIVEIQETRFAGWNEQLRALLRDEIDLAYPVSASDLVALQRDPRMFVFPSAAPLVHWLQVMPRGLPARLPALRRALAATIDRPALIATLYPPNSSDGAPIVRPAMSLCAATSYAAPLEGGPRDADLALAATLAALARQDVTKRATESASNAAAGQEASAPANTAREALVWRPLRLGVGPESAPRRAADQIAALWRRAGLEVELVSDVAECDVQYRAARVIDPVFDLWKVLASQGDSSLAELQEQPVWVRQQLLAIEASTDWPTAVLRTQQLQRDLLVDVQLIPLWEVDEHLVVRRHVTGIPTPWIHPYSQIEQWRVQPWYLGDEF